MNAGEDLPGIYSSLKKKISKSNLLKTNPGAHTTGTKETAIV